MKKILLITFVITFGQAALISLFAADKDIDPGIYRTTIFEDEFSGESLNKKWGMYKSASTVRDGVMVGITPDDADHPSVNTIRFEPRADLEVAVSFKFNGSKRFSVMYRDKAYKGTHAGHICHVVVQANRVTLYDTKTGIFKNEIYDARKAGTLDEATKELLKSKQQQVKLELDENKWHDLLIRIQGDVMEVFVDGKKAGRFQSEGFAHQAFDQVNLTTSKKEMLYDRFKIKGTGK